MHLINGGGFNCDTSNTSQILQEFPVEPLSCGELKSFMRDFAPQNTP